MNRDPPTITRRQLLATTGAVSVGLSGCAGNGDGGDDSPEEPLPEPATERGYYDPLIPSIRRTEYPSNALRVQVFEGETIREHPDPFDSYLIFFQVEVLSPLQIERPIREFDRVVLATSPNRNFFTYAILDGVPIPTDIVPMVIESGGGIDSAHVYEEGSHGGFSLFSSTRSAIATFATSDEQIFVVPDQGESDLSADDLLIRVIDTWNGTTGSLLRENESARRLFEVFPTPGATVSSVRLADGTGGDRRYIPEGARAGGMGLTGGVSDDETSLRYAGVYPEEATDRGSFEAFLEENWGPDLGLGLAEPTIEADGDVLLATDGRYDRRRFVHNR